jgi:hypothetical protein
MDSSEFAETVAIWPIAFVSWQGIEVHRIHAGGDALQ